MNKIYTVCIGDNHALFRAGIKSLISTNPQYNVTCEGEDGMEIINAIRENTPDILLLDLTMPKMNGMDVIKVLKKRHPELKILVLTIHNTEEYIHTALKAGANGYVLKDASFEELMLAINAVLNNKTYLDPGASDKVIQHFIGKKSPQIETEPLWDTLTVREREHLKLIAEAYTNKKIADYLCISVKTVEKHRANLMRKLDLHSAVELTAFAIEKGLIDKS
ncbi:MAG: response regulator transcription factor [Thiotrichaceae bacterium]|nr:response regulator transcription factor [Thiotrichaceae bacterium]